MKRISDLAPLAIAIVIIAIVVAMGATVLTNMDDEVYTANTIANETFNATTATGNEVTVAEASTDNFHQLTDVTVYQSVAQSTEITAVKISDASAGKFKVNSTVDADSESVAYNYEDENTATTTIGHGISALSDFSGWFSIMVLVVIASIIIGIVVTSFGGKGRSGI